MDHFEYFMVKFKKSIINLEINHFDQTNNHYFRISFIAQRLESELVLYMSFIVIFEKSIHSLHINRFSAMKFIIMC